MRQVKVRMGVDAPEPLEYEVRALCKECGLFRSKEVSVSLQSMDFMEMAFLSEITSHHEHRAIGNWEVTWCEARYFTKRDYVAELRWYREGKSDEAWRNTVEGFICAVRTIHHGSSLQAVMDEAARLRGTISGSEFAFVEVSVTSRCATCTAYSVGKRRWGLFSPARCPRCDGKDTKRQELTARL